MEPNQTDKTEVKSLNSKQGFYKGPNPAIFFQCPCCREVFELEPDVKINRRSFVLKDSEVLTATIIKDVILTVKGRIVPEKGSSE